VAPALSTPGMKQKRRALRRFFFAAVVAISPAQAQQPLPAVKPVVDALLADEAELASALGATSLDRLQRLAWRNHEVAFALVKSDPPIVAGDPAAAALRAAHVTCANAHSAIGMLASGAVSVLMSNAGGANTRVENDVNRDGFNFFLKPYVARRAQCAELSGLPLPPGRLRGEADQLFSAFSPIRTPRITADDRRELETSIAELAMMERAITAAIASNDVEWIRSALLRVAAMRRFLLVRDDPDMPRRDFAIFKECRWAIGHAGQILREVHDGLTRPEARASQFESARRTLDQYRDTKADCAYALGLPRGAGLVQGLTEADFAK
jgi:hypothetical protein